MTTRLKTSKTVYLAPFATAVFALVCAEQSHAECPEKLGFSIIQSLMYDGKSDVAMDNKNELVPLDKNNETFTKEKLDPLMTLTLINDDASTKRQLKSLGIKDFATFESKETGLKSYFSKSEKCNYMIKTSIKMGNKEMEAMIKLTVKVEKAPTGEKAPGPDLKEK